MSVQQGRGQSGHSPGGVYGSYIWFAADSSGARFSYKSKLKGADSVIQITGHHRAGYLNFNIAPVFENSGLMPISLGDSSLDNATFFTVYQRAPGTKGEKAIWHLLTGGKASSVLTTDRLADLDSNKYRNYIDLVPQNAEISTYIQLKRKDTLSSGPAKWIIGAKPSQPQVPISSFEGMIPEFIAYKRALDPEERLKITTYLAIKYGVTLSDPTPVYISSTGKMIWDGTGFKDYYNNIAGIGRDDSTGLHQLKSSSSNTPGLLTISTQKFVDNDSFVLWGENGKPFALPAKNQPGAPPLLEKKWAVSLNLRVPLNVDIVFDTKSVDAPMASRPVFWLAIDRLGQGRFDPKQTDFFKMDSLDANGLAYYKNVLVGDKGESKNIFGFFIGKELITATTINEPSCENPLTGKLSVKILGGQLPYQVTLSDNSGKKSYDQQINQTVATIEKITPGEYILTVRDKAGLIYTDLFTVNNSDAIKPANVAENYMLQRGKPIRINADSLMPATVTYQWNGPNGFSSFSPQVTISQPGNYQLICTNNDCRYYQNITVAEAPYTIFKVVTVYPNPSFGDYTTDISLDKAGPVSVSVFSITGMPLNVWKGAGKANYRFSGNLRTPGTYTIYYRSGNYTVSRKITIYQ